VATGPAIGRLAPCCSAGPRRSRPRRARPGRPREAPGCSSPAACTGPPPSTLVRKGSGNIDAPLPHPSQRTRSSGAGRGRVRAGTSSPCLHRRPRRARAGPSALPWGSPRERVRPPGPPPTYARPVGGRLQEAVRCEVPLSLRLAREDGDAPSGVEERTPERLAGVPCDTPASWSRSVARAARPTASQSAARSFRRGRVRLPPRGHHSRSPDLSVWRRPARPVPWQGACRPPPSPTDLSHLSTRARALVRLGNAGAGCPYPSRSEANFAVCLAMFGAG